MSYFVKLYQIPDAITFFKWPNTQKYYLVCIKAYLMIVFETGFKNS